MEQKGGKKEIRGGFVPKLRSIVPSSLAHCWAFFFFFFCPMTGIAVTGLLLGLLREKASWGARNDELYHPTNAVVCIIRN